MKIKKAYWRISLAVEHGFRKMNLCFTSLLESFEMWTKYVDVDQANTIHLEFQKAFDESSPLKAPD